MVYRFGRFELDGARFELREGGARVAVEPQVLSLLLLLIDKRDRLVTRDEMVEVVWNGRIVSDSALSSRIKSARRALGDDGRAQQLIRTVHGRGFRFIQPVEIDGAAAAPVTVELSETPAPHGPSIAVLPLRPVGDAGPEAFLADALPHELIAELSRLRWLFVIARSSSFQFRDVEPDIRRIGATLGVRYCLGGSLESSRGRVAVSLELSDTRDCGIVWSERFDMPLESIHQLRPEIAARVVSALEIRLPDHEAQLARNRPPEQLDAWSNYHLGLQHMFRFTRRDNQAAQALFERAIGQQPDFARAHAARSFTHFQNAFLAYRSDVAAETQQARRFAERAVELDSLDPSSNLALGRSHWLTGELDSSLGWIDRSVQLSPSFAHGVYARAWAETLLGGGQLGQLDADRAMALSPIDPLRYAMLGTRALSHLVRGEDADAARWADTAARTPGAHVLIAIIAAACQWIGGDRDKARAWAADARRRSPAVTQADFFRSFPFADASVRGRIIGALTALGL